MEFSSPPDRSPHLSRTPSWIATSAIQRTWRKFATDSARLPGESWSRWGRSLVLGFALSGLFTAGLTYAARSLEAHGLSEWDERQLQRIASQKTLSFVDAMVFQSPGNLAYLVPLTIASTVLAIRWSRPLVAASMVAAYVLARAFVFLGWALWDRPRPSMIAGGIASPGLHSFPSGHAALSLAAWGFLTYLWMRSSPRRSERFVAFLILLTWIAIINFSRLRVGAHWPSDVLGGLAIGFVWLACVIAALRRAEAVAGA